MNGTIRDRLQLDLKRPRGGYLEKVPDYVFGNGDWGKEKKHNGYRATLEFTKDGCVIVGRNRHNKLKGVAKAGGFVDMSQCLPFLQSIARPELEGTLLDGVQT